jgi:hypothetical protein
MTNFHDLKISLKKNLNIVFRQKFTPILIIKRFFSAKSFNILFRSGNKIRTDGLEGASSAELLIAKVNSSSYGHITLMLSGHLYSLISGSDPDPSSFGGSRPCFLMTKKILLLKIN